LRETKEIVTQSRKAAKDFDSGQLARQVWIQFAATHVSFATLRLCVMPFSL
jgi:hypothetical protein